MAKSVDKINKEKLKNTLASMASMFETGRVSKMKDIVTMYPTGIVVALGINYGGYMAKCAAPEKFIMEDLIKLAQILNIDIELILKVVVKESLKNVEKKDIGHLLQL